MKKPDQRPVEVWAHWVPLSQPIFVGVLFAVPSRGKEIFSFTYAPDWLKSGHAQSLDPLLGLYQGIQYAPHRLFHLHFELGRPFAKPRISAPPQRMAFGTGL